MRHLRCSVSCVLLREMGAALNPRYQPPSRDMLSNTLIPAWYAIERERVQAELEETKHVALTCDGWTSVAQDHYITVTVHFSKGGQLQERVLHTRAVYEAQTGAFLAEEIRNIMSEFHIQRKVVALTVDNAANMHVAARNLQMVKISCFAHSLNLAAQKVYTEPTVSRWAARIRAVVVWLRKASLAKPVMKEKQRLLSMSIPLLAV